jgi:hypothetical protein
MESSTPETDGKLADGFTSEEMQEHHVPASFARKLETERDQARRELSRFTEREAADAAKRVEFLETLDRKVASNAQRDLKEDLS